MIIRLSAILALVVLLHAPAHAQQPDLTKIDMSTPEAQEMMRQMAIEAARVAAVRAAEVAENAKREPYSPTVGVNIPRTVYWGDTHVHTRNSPDAFTFGNTTLAPEDA